MPNEIMIPDAANLPAHIRAAIAANPNLIQDNLDAANGIGGGAVPTITANQGMFKTKIDGVEEVVQINVPGMGLINAPKIAAVILKGKPALDRAWFATAYTQGSEALSPDCSSEDGIKPKADSPSPQCTSCAGCAQNMWATAKLQDGSPGKGKACAEKKRLAIYANNGIFRFNVPPASLGDFAAYARQLAGHGLPLSAVITTISFDPATPTKLVFGFQGVLPDAAYAKLAPEVNGEKVQAIMQNFSAPATQQLAAPNTPAEPAGPSAAELAVAAAKKADDEKKAAAATKKAADAAKKAADAKKVADEKAAAAATPATDDLGLGIDLGMGAADIVLNTAAEGENAELGLGEELTDADLAGLFAV